MHQASQTDIGTQRLVDLQPSTLGRPLMAASGLIALRFDPPSYSIAPGLVMPLLTAYLIFSILVLINETRSQTRESDVDWLDLTWGMVLTSVSGGTSSVLFFFLLLPIIARAFREGFSAGWRMTLVATGGFLAFGLVTSPGGVLFEINRAVTRPLTLVILGYVIAREGGVQFRARCRLDLIARLGTVANPRFGTERTLLNAARHIRSTYSARECLIMLPRPGDSHCLLMHATEHSETTEKILAEALAPMLKLPRDACLANGPRRTIRLGEASKPLSVDLRAIADLLDAKTVITVPMDLNEAHGGRIFLLDARLSSFDQTELSFLASAARQLQVLVEKIGLLDQIATMAAEHGRKKLANDLHDRALQPYVGLQLGLAATLRRGDCPAPIAAEMQELLRLTEQGVSELRSILAGQQIAGPGENVLTSSVARLSATYREQFGIDVSYEHGPAIHLSDRLSVDLLSMITEGLSNVRRHSSSRWARLSLHGTEDAVELRIANAAEPGAQASFSPRSLRERADALGGSLSVDSLVEGEVSVNIHIPL